MEQQQERYIVKNPGKIVILIISAIAVIFGARFAFDAMEEQSTVITILGTIGSVLSFSIAVSNAVVNLRRYENWIEVTGSSLELYKNWKLIETVDAANVSLVFVRPINGTKAHSITLYGENGRELIVLNANADNIDLLINLIGRDKLLVKQ